MLLTAALQALVVEPEEECCGSAGGDTTGPPPGNVQLVGDSDLALTSSPDMPDVRQQQQRTQPLDGQSPVAPSALWDVDSLGAAVMPAILSSSWDTANDAVAAGAYLPPPVQLGGSVPARAPINSNLNPVGKLAAQVCLFACLRVCLPLPGGRDPVASLAAVNCCMWPLACCAALECAGLSLKSVPLLLLPAAPALRADSRHPGVESQLHEAVAAGEEARLPASPGSESAVAR
jgi:hypothetical protein